MPPAAASIPTDLRLRVVSALSEVSADAWNACANPGVPSSVQLQSEACAAGADITQAIPYNPFISHEFLDCLEASGSATARAGWQPQHLLAETPDGAIAGVVPCYLKSHSRGEYVFDRGWAEAYERAGGEYYPKLQVSVPFTPATGRRLLLRPAANAEQIRAGLTAGLIELCRRHEASSVHLTFLPEPEGRFLADNGFLHRTDQQFHWENAGLRHLRRVPRSALSPQAQDHPPRAARGAGARHHRALADRLGPHRRGLGRVLRVLHGDRLAQVGPPLPDARSSTR